MECTKFQEWDKKNGPRGARSVGTFTCVLVS
jgi:hypothetical protein